MAKLLTPKEVKGLKKGTKVKSITGKILTVGKDKLYTDDLSFGLTPYSVYQPKTKKNNGLQLNEERDFNHKT